MKILVTGSAGFIGYHVAATLLKRGDQVIGLDNLNSYYDVTLKQSRLELLSTHSHFKFYPIDLAESQSLKPLFEEENFTHIIHLAAQAGIRYSITNPEAYVQSNLVGFANLLEASQKKGIDHLVFASSSSVYGANTRQPFSEHDHTDHPVSFYAATKKANEMMAHTYAHLYQMPCTGLRFFTVYGPWGRPDMALFKFTNHILENKPIEVFNHGDMYRDFTYIDDIVEGVLKVLKTPAKANLNWSGDSPDPASSLAPYRLYNIGNSQPVKLSDFIETLEAALGKKAIKQNREFQKGEVYSTYSDVRDLYQDFQYAPRTTLKEGVEKFVVWYREYYQL